MACAPSIPATTMMASAPPTDDPLGGLLQKYYGFEEFRPGQRELVSALVGGGGEGPKDALGVMATGQGKSCCFQLPALHTGRTVVCVSPLISLMQDQVGKLNESVGRVWAKQRPGASNEIATYLGSAQSKSSVEQEVREGKFLFVYLSPEKVATNGLDLLIHLQATGRLACIAIDEAHCVSEWGNDFRPDYKRLDCIRRTPELQHVPMVALTATAPPKVQEDIVSVLQLRHGFAHYVGDFYRRNLKFAALPKTSFANDFKPLIDGVKAAVAAKKPYDKPTIVYAISKREVSEICISLQTAVSAALRQAGQPEDAVQVLMYHAAMSHGDREASHRAFLTGMRGSAHTPVIVATVAFGMGIDKPDVRRIIHYGPPRTLEAYYQQAGRAGRDGLPAVCTMYFSTNDFSRYSDDFWAPRLPDGSINQKQKVVLDESLGALRKYALLGMDQASLTCRHDALIDYLLGRRSEPNQQHEWCECDCCVKLAGIGVQKMDFGAQVRLILNAVGAWNGRSRSVYLDALMGTGKAGLEKKYLKLSVLARGTGEALFGGFKATQYPTREVLGALLEACVHTGLVEKRTESFDKGGGGSGGRNFSIKYEVLDLTTLGRSVLDALVVPNGAAVDPAPYVRMFPPHAVTDLLEKQAKKREAVKAELASLSGQVDVAAVPENELKAGDGAVLKAILAWGRFQMQLVKRIEDEASSEEQRAAAKKRMADGEALLEVLEKWRSAEAVRLTLAPATVLPEGLSKRVAYAVVMGSPATSDFLDACGVRTGDVEKLSAALQQWAVETGNACSPSAGEKRKLDGEDEDEDEDAFVLPPLSVWNYQTAPTPPGVSKMSATILESVDLFVQGLSFDVVGVKRAKQIQANTVVSHLFTALAHSCTKLVNSREAVERLMTVFPRPSEVLAIQAAEAKLGVDLQDPKTPIKPIKELLGEDNMWYTRVKAYALLKGMGFPFQDDAVRSTAATRLAKRLKVAPQAW